MLLRPLPQQMKRLELCIKCWQKEKLRPIRVVAFSLFFQIKLFQSWRRSSETMRGFKFAAVAGKLPFSLSKWTHHCPWNVHKCPERPSLQADPFKYVPVCSEKRLSKVSPQGVVEGWHRTQHEELWYCMSTWHGFHNFIVVAFRLGLLQGFCGKTTYYT